MGSLFGGGGGARAQMPDLPKIEKPVVMPVADPEAQKRDELKKLAMARSRSTTRAGTILSSDDTLG